MIDEHFTEDANRKLDALVHQLDRFIFDHYTKFSDLGPDHIHHLYTRLGVLKTVATQHQVMLERIEIEMRRRLEQR